MPAAPFFSEPASAYAEGAANSTLTITHQPVGGTFAEDATVRLYVQASSSTNNLLTYQWYRSADGAADGGDPVSSESICDDIPPSAGTYWYYVVVEDEAAHQSVRSKAAEVVVDGGKLARELTNGSFDKWANGSSHPWTEADHFPTPSEMPPWGTTHFYNEKGQPHIKVLETMDIKNNSYGLPTEVPGHPEYTNCAELAAYVESDLYQEVATIPGKLFDWSLWHGGRNYGGAPGFDTMAVVIGPALTDEESEYLGEYVSEVADYDKNTYEYRYGINATGYFNKIVNQVASEQGVSDPTKLTSGGQYATTYKDRTYYVYIASTERATWKHYSGVYTVPEGQGRTVFSFVNVKTSTGNAAAGNILTGIEFKAGTGVEISNDVAYDGGGQVMTTVAETGFSYGIVEERGSTTMAVSPTVTLNGATLSVSDKLGAGVSDWYTPDKPGSLMFGNLTPGKKYRVVAVPTSAVNTTLGANLNPGLVLDNGYYESVTIKAVADPLDGVQVTAALGEDGATAMVTVNPARADVEYALLDVDASGAPDPNKVVSASLDGAVDGGWVSTDQGSLTFPGLGLSTADTPRRYAVVARPKGYSEVGFADQVGAGAAVPVVMPSAAFVDVDAASVTRAASADAGSAKDTVTVTNKAKGAQRYLVYDVAVGRGEGDDWTEVPAGSSASFSVDAAKTYQVLASENRDGLAPSPGVRAYPAAPDPEVDFAAETVGKDGVVPATVEYRMQDNADAATWYFGDADGQPDAWVQGTGGSAVSLTPALDAMVAGGGGATLSYRTHADFLPAVYVEKSVVVPARPPAPSEGASGFAFDYTAEGVVPGATAAAGGAAVEARASSAAEWQRGTTDAPVSLSDLGWTGSQRDVQVRMAAVEGTDAASSAFASAANASASIPARPVAPAVQVIVDAANPDVYHFTGESSEVGASQYRVFSRDGTDGLWSACTAAANLAKGVTYEVRKAATESAFASVSVTRAASSAQVESVVGDMAERKYGFEARGESPIAALTLKNSGTSPASVDAPDAVVGGVETATVTMTGQPEASKGMGTVFAVTGQGGEVAGGGSLAWTVGLTSTAQDNLPAGTYEAVIAVAYKDATGGDASTYFTSLCSVSLVVAKATPDVPTLALGDVTATSIALSAQKPVGEPHVVALEYSTAAASGYNDASTLAGLVPATRYDLYARTKADANHNASLPAKISAYTAWAAPEPDAVVTANFSAETLSFAAAAYEAKDADGTSVLPNDTSVTGCIDVGGALYLRHKETAGSGGLTVPASDWVSFALPARPDAPAVTVVDAGDSRSADGAVSFAGSLALETDAGGWTSYGSTVGGLAPGTYTVRAQATGTAFASKPASVSVGVKNYLVEFDANGGLWAAGQEPGVLRVAADGSSTATAPTAPALEGYGLSGWSPVQGDGTVAAEAWDFGAAVTSDMTLRASWKANSYEVVFDPGVEAGAVPAVTGSMTSQTGFVYDGDPVALSACIFERANYVFAGWATERGGAVAYADKAEVSNLTTGVDPVTLYAVWARPAISAAVPVNATVMVDGGGNFRCPSAFDPDRPDAGGYFISSTTPYPLKVESVSFGLVEGANGIFTEAAKMQATVNGLAVDANAGAVGTSPAAGAFKLAASAGGAPVYLPLSLSLAYPGGTMTYSSSERPFATLTYKLAFDDEAAASGEGV